MTRCGDWRGARTYEIASFVLVCVALLSACGGDDEVEVSQPREGTAAAATTESGATTSEHAAGAVDANAGGVRVACGTKSLTVEFSSESGAYFSAGAKELTSSRGLRTSSAVFEFAAGCRRAGDPNQGGTVPEPFEVETAAVTLQCEQSKTIDLSGRAGIYDGKSGYEISAAPAGSSEFFVKTHWELGGGDAYIIYSPEHCRPS